MTNPCIVRDMTDAQLEEFIEDADRKQGGDDWWNDDFFEEAKVIAEELKAWRELDRTLAGNDNEL